MDGAVLTPHVPAAHVSPRRSLSSRAAVVFDPAQEPGWQHSAQHS